MALKHAGRWATVDSFYKILKGQEFTALCSASPELRHCCAFTSRVREVSAWLNEPNTSRDNQLQRGDLFQAETNARMKHFAASTPITTAGFTRQKSKHFYSAKPHRKSPNEEGSSHYTQQRQSNRSQLIQAGARMRRDGDKAHVKHT